MKTKLYFILADENLFHPDYILGLIKNLGNNYDIVGITMVRDSYKKGFVDFLKQQLLLWGPLGFLYIAFTSSARSFLDKFNLKNNLSLKNITQKNKIKYIESFDVNDREHLEYLRKLKIDIIISSCGQIFKKDLLKLPKIACINRHSAILPKYGGVLPVFWAMYFGEKEFGVSLHYMVEKIDQGDILSQVKIPLKKENSLFKNYLLAFDKSVGATLEALENIKSDKIVGHFYPNEKQYFSFPTKERIKEFKIKEYKSFSIKDLW